MSRNKPNVLWDDFPIVHQYLAVVEKMMGERNHADQIKLRIRAKNLLARMECTVKRAALTEAKERGYDTTV